MNLNPLVLIQRGLALFGVGGLYLYKHNSLKEKKPIIEGPYYSWIELQKNMKLVDPVNPSAILEERYRIRLPVGAVKPISGEK